MILGPTKCCPRCKTVYLATLEFFNSDKRYKSGISSWCRKCNRANSKKYYQKYRENPEDWAKVSRTYWKSTLKRLYGLTLEQYDAMVEAAEGKCAICGVKPKKICVDHCHETGAVRGLLCAACNTAIGQLGDTPSGVRRAIDYLERSGAAAA